VSATATADAELLSTRATAVSVHGVSKTFRLPHQQYSTLKERALHPFRASTYDELHAVDDVSFDVGDGEFFGIVGRNGSGKSTLLKCLAGIYSVDRGEIGVFGRLSPFIELGVGFNPDLTARDNVIINAIMLGLTRKQARERFDDVIAFAELEEFIDLKLKNYSSGMHVRLAFAVAIQVDADILLIDEVLAVGDIGFQQKCYDEFYRLKREGKTIVFVTHDMSAVERFCDRAMLIENGGIMKLADPSTIARAYNELNFGRLTPGDGEVDNAGGGTIITRAWFEDESGTEIAALGQGGKLRVSFEFEVGEALDEPVIGLTLRNDTGATIVQARSDRGQRKIGSLAPGERRVATFEFDNWLAPSRYSASPWIAREGTGADVLAVAPDVATLLVHGYATGGVLEVPQTFELERP
jgi:ABC-type polysaccharide/polyol phosphate transport system ATPase subunit